MIYYFCKYFNSSFHITSVAVISDAQPTDGEKAVYEEVQRVLLSSESILQELAVYKGAGKEIREAISTPSEECQRKAWSAVVPLVTKLKRFYDFSKELGKGNLSSNKTY